MKVRNWNLKFLDPDRPETLFLRPSAKFLSTFFPAGIFNAPCMHAAKSTLTWPIISAGGYMPVQNKPTEYRAWIVNSLLLSSLFNEERLIDYTQDECLLI